MAATGPLEIADRAHRPRHDVLPENHFGPGRPIPQSVVEHRECSGRGLLAGLENQHQRSGPGITITGKHVGGAQQAGHMRVMTTTVHNRHHGAVRNVPVSVLA
jgi:hypothetical protein